MSTILISFFAVYRYLLSLNRPVSEGFRFDHLLLSYSLALIATLFIISFPPLFLLLIGGCMLILKWGFSFYYE